MSHIDLNIRYAMNAYLASCPGQKARASSTCSAKFAAERLASKIHPMEVIGEARLQKSAPTGQTEVWRCPLYDREA